MNYGVGHKCRLDPKWLWPRLAAAVPIQPLAWEFPYATDVALKSKKEKEKKPTNNQIIIYS